MLVNGGVIFIDDLSEKLHPLPVRNIILMFLTSEINKNHAQLILTMHDVWQFSSERLRRDELWVTDKDERGVAMLGSIAEFKEDLVEEYLRDMYGGISVLKP